MAYAIPTKSHTIQTLSLDEIKTYIDGFIRYAESNSDLTFEVTKIGCGLAGYKERDIAPMFFSAPDNCLLPPGWREMENQK